MSSVGSTVGKSMLVAALLAASAARADDGRVPVPVTVDPSKETTITIKPFAAALSTKAVAPAHVDKRIASCSASVSHQQNGGYDVDCDADL